MLILHPFFFFPEKINDLAASSPRGREMVFGIIHNTHTINLPELALFDIRFLQ
jgi:hypothetical protein